MTKKIAFLFPGQGSQYVGMGKDFYDQFLEAREVFQEADEFLKMNFSELIFNGPSHELTLTKNSQPAIFITSVALLKCIEQNFPRLVPTVTAGLSLGEYTALVAGGKVNFTDALDLVSSRGLYMHGACLETQGTMRVVLGMEPQVVQPLLPSGVWIANCNCPGQVVIAGRLDQMEKAEEVLKSHGVRKILKLDVAGAFHTPLMQSAQHKLKEQILNLSLKESGCSLVMNVTGEYERGLDSLKENLIQQVVSPTYWEKSVRTINEDSVDLYLEIGPGKTLSGMNTKMQVSGSILNVDKLSDLDKLKEYYATT